MDRHIKAPLDREEVKTLEAGDYVYITGTVYTARDAKRIFAWTRHLTEEKNFQLN